MGALLILNYDVTDPDGLAAYRAVAGDVLASGRGARRVVRTADTVDLGEGHPAGRHTVIWRYESVAAAQEVYDSPAYRQVLAGRLGATRPCVAMIVETLD